LIGVLDFAVSCGSIASAKEDNTPGSATMYYNGDIVIMEGGGANYVETNLQGKKVARIP